MCLSLFHRSLGCILYELFVGTPPFYTNSIFQLVNLICRVWVVMTQISWTQWNKQIITLENGSYPKWNFKNYFGIYRWFSLTWTGAKIIDSMKQKELIICMEIKFPKDFFGPPTWSPWCYGKIIYSLANFCVDYHR